MNWMTILILAAVVGLVFMMKRSGQISTKTAATYLKNGAVVIEARVNICNHLEFQTTKIGLINERSRWPGQGDHIDF